MADYFQDITPPKDLRSTPGASAQNTPTPTPSSAPSAASEGEKTIRNIPVMPARPRARVGAGEVRESAPPPPRNSNRLFMWGAATLALVILGAIALVALRPTTVSVIPRSQAVLFDETSRITAYPAESAPPNSLSFTINKQTFDDSQVVAAAGTERVEERASGTITVYNNFSTQPVKLLKNTRFQAPDGHVFRSPAEVLVPGKKGTSPGRIDVTVFADAPGEGYNIGAVSRFTLPGLKSTPDMYTNVYASSASAMTRGFSGERPKASPAALEEARSQIRARIEEKIRAAATAQGSETIFAFKDLARVTYETLPPASEGSGNVRIAERATMELPLFQASAFASAVAQKVSADAGESGIQLRPGSGFNAIPAMGSDAQFGTVPLELILQGKALLVWKVDTGALAAALAGRDRAAFETIVRTFSGIEEAHARIEPFWKGSFPTNPESIKIKLEEPKPAA